MDPRVKAMLEAEDRTASTVVVSEVKYFAQKVENSPFVNYSVAALGLVYVVHWFYTKGFDLNLDIFNYTLMFLGLLVHKTPIRFMQAAAEATKDVFGVIVQFPFYAGIQGMMASSGLVVIIAQGFVSISTTFTYPYWTYLSGAVINFFIPSSGGIWSPSGPFLF